MSFLCICSVQMPSVDQMTGKDKRCWRRLLQQINSRWAPVMLFAKGWPEHRLSAVYSAVYSSVPLF